MYRYFVETLLIATTSRTTSSAPITVQIHISPPIHPNAWFIIEPLSFRYDQPIPTDLAAFPSGWSLRCAFIRTLTGRAKCALSWDDFFAIERD